MIIHTDDDDMVIFSEAIEKCEAKEDTTWRHCSGTNYRVTGHSFDGISSTLMILYRTAGISMETHTLFSLPYSEWFDDVSGVPRFEQIHKYEFEMTVNEAAELAGNLKKRKYGLD